MKGIFEHKDFWTSNPFDSDRRYIDEHAVVWLIEIESLGDSSKGTWTKWRARPESDPVKYGVSAGAWPVTATTATSDSDAMVPLASAIDGWVDKYKGRLTSAVTSGASTAGKPKTLTSSAAQGVKAGASSEGSGLGTLLLVLLGLYILGSDRRRYVSAGDERWFS